jgi:Rrf2 family cysteine metabolism transcriptional repressor
MRISTKGRYALEALLDLALQDRDGFVALRGVGLRRGLSENYLEQLFSELRRCGIVTSLRGQQGGYRLARDPTLITVGEVLRAVEGPLVPVACIAAIAQAGCGPVEEAQACPRQENCVTRLLWIRMMDAITLAADGVTLADLIADCRNTQVEGASDYAI